MKKVLIAAAALALSAPAAMANPDYPLKVQANGVNYLCKAETEVINGQLSRRCIRDDDDAAALATGGLFAAGLAGSGATAAIVTGLVFVAAAASSSSDNPTNGTN